MTRGEHDPRPRRKRRRALKVLKWTGISLLTLIALVVVAVLIVARTGPGRDFARKKALESIKDLVRGKVDIGEIEGDLLGDFKLKDVTIEDQTGEPAISAEEIEVGYSPTKLLKKEVALDKLHVRGLDVNLRRLASGKINLSELFVPPKGPKDDKPSPWKVGVEDLWIRDARVDLSPIAPELGVVEDISLRGKVEAGGGVTEVTLDTVEFSLPTYDEKLEGALTTRIDDGDIRASLRLEGDDVKIRIPTFMLTSDPQTLVTAIVVHAQPSLINRFLPPERQLLVPADVSVMVASTGFEEFAGLVGVDAGPLSLAAAGRFNVPQQTLAAGVSLPRVDPSEVVAGLPPMQVGPLRAVGRIGADLKFQGFAAGQFQGFGVARQTFDVAAEGTPQRIEARLESRGAGARIAADGAIRLGGDEPVLELTEVEARIPDLEALVGRDLPLRGRVRGTVSAEGPLDRLEVFGHIDSAGFGAQDVYADSLSLSFHGRGLPDQPFGTVALKAVGVSVAGQRIDRAELRGEIDRDQSLAARVELASGDRRLAAAVRGRLEDERAVLRLAELDARVDGVKVDGQADRVVVGFDGGVAVRDLRLAGAGGTVALSGQLRPTPAGPQIVADVDIDDIQLQPLAALVGEGDSVTGEVNAEGEVRFGPRGIGGDLKYGVTLVYQDYPELAVEGAIDLQRRRLELALDARVGQGLGRAAIQLVMVPPRRPTRPEAWQRVGRDAIESATVEVAIADFGSWARWVPQSPVIDGAMAAKLTVTEDVEDFGLVLKLDEVQTMWTTGKLDLDLRSELHDRKLETRAEFTAGGLARGKLAATLRTPRDLTDVSAWRAMGIESVEKVGLELDDAWPTDEVWAALDMEPMRGSLDARIFASGAEKTIDVWLDLSRFRAGPLRTSANLAVEANLAGNETKASLVVGLEGKGMLRVEGTAKLGWDGLMSAEVDKLRRVPLSVEVASTEPISIPDLFRSLGAGEVVAGVAEVRASLEGTIADPRGFAEVEVREVQYDDARLEVATARAELTKEQWSLALRANQENAGFVAARLEGERPAAPDQNPPLSRSLEVEARGFELGLLSGLGPRSVRGIRGQLAADLAVRGTQESIDTARGTLKVQGGQVVLSGPLRRLSDIDLLVEAGARSFDLRVDAAAGEGSIDGRIRVFLDGLIPRRINGRLDLSKVPLATSAGVAMLSADVKVVSEEIDLDEPSLELRVSEGLVRMPEGAGRDLHDIGPPKDVVFVNNLDGGLLELEEKKGSLLPPITLVIDIPSTLRIRGEQISGVVQANLDITFHGDAVEYLGHVELQRAWVEIFRHRYTVERATADFPAVREFNPFIDVRLAHEFKTAAFFVIVKGNLQDPPAPEFASEPALYDESQMLGFFLGGSPDELNRTNVGVGTRAAGAATGLVTSQVTNVLEEIIPVLDVLRLETSGAGATPDQLLAGKWLTEKLLVGYRARLSADQVRQNINEFTLEWWIARRWLIQAFYGDRNVGAADFIYIRRF